MRRPNSHSARDQAGYQGNGGGAHFRAAGEADCILCLHLSIRHVLLNASIVCDLHTTPSLDAYCCAVLLGDKRVCYTILVVGCCQGVIVKNSKLAFCVQARKRAVVAAALEEGREGAGAANKLSMEVGPFARFFMRCPINVIVTMHG